MLPVCLRVRVESRRVRSMASISRKRATKDKTAGCCHHYDLLATGHLFIDGICGRIKHLQNGCGHFQVLFPEQCVVVTFKVCQVILFSEAYRTLFSLDSCPHRSEMGVFGVQVAAASLHDLEFCFGFFKEQ